MLISTLILTHHWQSSSKTLSLLVKKLKVTAQSFLNISNQFIMRHQKQDVNHASFRGCNCLFSQVMGIVFFPIGNSGTHSSKSIISQDRRELQIFPKQMKLSQNDENISFFICCKRFKARVPYGLMAEKSSMSMSILLKIQLHCADCVIIYRAKMTKFSHNSNKMITRGH